MNPTGSTAAGATPTAPAGGFKEGGWYNGMMYQGGKFLAPGTLPNGQQVSAEVNRQSSVAQGKDPNAIATYLGQGTSGAGASGGGAMAGTGVMAPPGGFNLQAAYDSAYTNNPELQKVKADLVAKAKAHDEALLGVNDNPFYSEARRIGQQAKIDDAYNNDVRTLTAQQAVLEADAQQKINIAQGQYNIDRQEYQDSLDLFKNVVSAGGLTTASDQDLAQYAIMTGIPVSMLKGIQAKTAKTGSGTATQLIQSTDSEGNLNLAVVNKKTGEVVGQSTINGAGKTSVSAASQQQFNNTASTIKPAKSPGGQSVGIFPQLVAQYSAAMTLPNIYKAYSASDIGKKYGAPIEDPAYIQNLYSLAKGQ